MLLVTSFDEHAASPSSNLTSPSSLQDVVSTTVVPLPPPASPMDSDVLPHYSSCAVPADVDQVVQPPLVADPEPPPSPVGPQPPSPIIAQPQLSTHPMLTRSKCGIVKPKHRADLASLQDSRLIQALFSTTVPKGFKSSAKHPQWLMTIEDKMAALRLNDT
ncbi:unnamed protein product [Lactuca virosa]|uniref:Uncharacterized protein n=1 Tax=Lactuca virosa TaxID=75947 RepID=A0AAU9PG44_9ASTR|nr:unnamed protein product [Lactuca virosa]